jgi:hypothetical protein
MGMVASGAALASSTGDAFALAVAATGTCKVMVPHTGVAGQGGTFVGLRYQRRITIGVEQFDDAINRRSSNDDIAIEA